MDWRQTNSIRKNAQDIFAWSDKILKPTAFLKGGEKLTKQVITAYDAFRERVFFC